MSLWQDVEERKADFEDPLGNQESCLFKQFAEDPSMDKQRGLVILVSAAIVLLSIRMRLCRVTKTLTDKWIRRRWRDVGRKGGVKLSFKSFQTVINIWFIGAWKWKSGLTTGSQSYDATPTHIQVKKKKCKHGHTKVIESTRNKADCGENGGQTNYITYTQAELHATHCRTSFLSQETICTWFTS